MKSILKCGQCTPCRKHVSFDGCRQVYMVDDIDRSPVPVTRSLSYNDILELKQLKINMMAPRSDRSFCTAVPVALVPLLPVQETPPPPRPASAPPTEPMPPKAPSLQQRRKFSFTFLPVVAPMTNATTPESSAPSTPDALPSSQDKGNPIDTIPTITSTLPTPAATPETEVVALQSASESSQSSYKPSGYFREAPKKLDAQAPTPPSSPPTTSSLGLDLIKSQSPIVATQKAIQQTKSSQSPSPLLGPSCKPIPSSPSLPLVH